MIRTQFPIALSALVLSSAIGLAGCSILQAPASLFTGGDQPSLESRLALAKLCEKHSDEDRATKLYEEMLHQEPTSIEGRHRLALIAARKGDFAKARSLFVEAIGMAPANPALYNDFGYCCYLEGRFEEAERHLSNALELKPDMHAAWSNLALVYAQQERFERCRVAFAKASDGHAKVHCSMGYVYAQAAKFEEAKQEFDSALSIDADCLAAAEGLLQVSQRIEGREPVTLASTFGSTAATSKENLKREIEIHEPSDSQSRVDELSLESFDPPDFGTVRSGQSPM